MTQQYVSLKLEGDFIDSFIYSGALFLVHANSKITTHRWESLLSSVLDEIRSEGLFEFLKDVRSKGIIENESNKEIFIDEAQLKKSQASEIQLDGWPTDINIYANKFYIASEKGVEEVAYDWREKKIDAKNRFSIWKNYAYKISATDGHRIAIAAGAKGVISARPGSGYINQKTDVTTLLEVDSNDCEWIGSTLIANSISGAYLFSFDALPEKPSVPDGDYWERFNLIKNRAPVTREISFRGVEVVTYAWIAGENLFSLLSNGVLAVGSIDDGGHGGIAVEINSKLSKFFEEARKIRSARSGLFGAAIEIGNKLHTVTESGVDFVSERPVSWRVFPRAKNYSNHLHIIERDHLCIRAYFPPSISGKVDSFGIDTDDIR